jgi:hypothetical protein
LKLTGFRGNRILWISLILMLVWWAVYLLSIDHFPPFIDELIHIHGGEQAATEGLLTNANLGRQFTIWWMMLFQPHLGGPIWIGRVAALLITSLSVAAVISIGRLTAGVWGAALAGLFYALSSYNYFFGRMALADPIAGAAVLLAVYFCYRLTRRFDLRDAFIVGIMLFLALGAKISTLPYLGVPIAAALTLRPVGRPWRKQIQWGLTAFFTGAVLISIFIVVLRFFGEDFFSNSFSYALTNRGATSLSTLLDPSRILTNIQFTLDIFAGYFGVFVTILAFIAVIILVLRRQFFLPLCLLAPLTITWTNRIQESRFLYIAGALLLLCLAVVLAQLIASQRRSIKLAVLGLIAIWGLLQWLPFARTAALDPAGLPLPVEDFKQYIWADASGFGLQEIRELLRPHRPVRVIGLLSNCQALRYLALADFPVECPNLNPSGENMDELSQLMNQGRATGVFVVLENLGYVPTTAPGTLLTTIQRPGDGAALSVYDLSPTS